LKAAELTLKKAVALAPKDEFSHTTLGIVFYRQSKYDDAVAELTKALGINPKSATAHNYLGITASQKGWQEAAEKEMLDAIAVNPDYADAHFNLAVVYATNSPPAKEQAKLHYLKATSLGAEKDPALEKLLH
jgi:Tfp pilus assembly protein PilF